MSTRINKQIGYGLKNLCTREGTRHSWEPNDSRWDYTKFRADWHDDVSKEQDLRQYLDWCRAHKDDLKRLGAAEYGRDVFTEYFLMERGLQDRIKRKDTHWAAPYSAVLWDYEAGLKDVMLFTPPEHYHDWRRHDNIIDYYEESDDNGPVVRATFLDWTTGIWPHSGVMKRFRSPTPEVDAKLAGFTSKLQVFGSDIAGNREKWGGEIVYFPANGWQSIVKGTYITDPDLLEHFRRDWRPVIPLGVLALIEYLGCFPDAYGQEGIVNSLRPMIYVTWG